MHGQYTLYPKQKHSSTQAVRPAQKPTSLGSQLATPLTLTHQQCYTPASASDEDVSLEEGSRPRMYCKIAPLGRFTRTVWPLKQ